jgi:exodeoxyribonuclease-5
MTARPAKLGDEAARIVAISSHDRSLLVEAGAGSGKTAVMAARIVFMLTDGVKPASVAAVTFTELAASELLARVREFVDSLLAGNIPLEMRAALPDGLDAKRMDALRKAHAEIDDITCSTIHGFCQRLIKPFPVEAGIDPGASVMDRGEADQLFDDLLEDWLRQRLTADGELLAELVTHDPKKAVDTVRRIAAALRGNRMLGTPAAPPPGDAVRAFLECVDAFRTFIDDVAAVEKETAEIVAKFDVTAEPLRTHGNDESAAALVRLVTSEPEDGLCTKAGTFRAYKHKGKWATAAKSAGLSKADADRMNDEAQLAYDACCQAYDAIRTKTASRIVAELLREIRPLIDLFQAEKRRTALLDFDDLIASAANLLRRHEPVRQALAGRFAHVLVDEFQDTDPLQTEIFWRLCGDPPSAFTTADWTGFTIRPGALFLVGDPKQAIYRFRSADVQAYLRARETLRAQQPGSVIQISTNFRSCRSILAYVNDRFVGPLSGPGQPGFTALDAFHDDREAPCVAALDVAVPNEGGKASSEAQRDCEAEAVAELCERLIGSRLVLDRNGKHRECRAGDIALLAPTGAELWRYEEALERRGIPVSTQAGKGLYRRQEMQDCIAIARVLADSRDTLAFGALLRGPLAGLTEEDLLDLVWALPRSEDFPDRLPRLSRSIDPDCVSNELARDVIVKLQGLARRANSTTPHDLLSQAIDVLRVRPILVERYKGRAERALSNVDLFLDMARRYDVRGLRAFAETMTTCWSDEARAIEGRPDAQEEAVALYTMHAAKGLEWPIVVPINGMTRTMAPPATLIDRARNELHCPVFGVEPDGYEAALAAEKAEINNERVRLWYVATTRAKELLIIPRSNVLLDRSAWLALADLAIAGLPAIDVSKLPGGPPAVGELPANQQTREIFEAEAAQITAKTVCVEWIAPSRAENAEEPPDVVEAGSVFVAADDGSIEDAEAVSAPQGGRERGLVIHKLLEEVLTGETGDSKEALQSRAADLIRELGCEVSADAARGLSPDELADSALRGLTHPSISAVRAELCPEVPVYASSTAGAVEMVTAGIADAVAIKDGNPTLIVDWKSDVDPNNDTVAHYRAQVSRYLEATKIPLGLIVFVTTGKAIEVRRPGA